MPATLVGSPARKSDWRAMLNPCDPLLKRRAHDDVVDLAALDRGALERAGDDMAAERLGLRVVERAAIGLADRCARGGDDDGFTHGDLQSSDSPFSLAENVALSAG